MRRLVPAAVVALAVLPAGARAEAPWLTAHGRVAPALRLSAFGGTRSLGLGVEVPDDGAHAGWGGEADWAFADRVLEARGARVWQLASKGVASLSATLGLSGVVVPAPALDVGVGPHAGLTLSLGGPRFAVDLGLQSGAEAFFEAPARLPQRLLLGVRLGLGALTLSAVGRAGVDLVPGHAFIFRGEAVLVVGWARYTSAP